MDDRGRLEAIFARAQAAHDAADYKKVRELASQLLELANHHGDLTGMARAENLLGNAALHVSDGQSAERHYRVALEHYGAAGDRRGEAIVLLNLGTLALDIYLDLSTAREYYERSLPIFEECGNAHNVAIARSNLAEIARLEGDYGTAFELGMQSLNTFRARKDSTRIGWQLVNVAHYYLLRSEYGQAIDTLRHAYLYLVKAPNPERLADYFEIWFYLTCELGRYEIAARLLGFLDRYRRTNGVPRLALLMPWYRPRLEKLEQNVAAAELRRLKNEGEGLTLAQIDERTYGIAI